MDVLPTKKRQWGPSAAGAGDKAPVIGLGHFQGVSTLAQTMPVTHQANGLVDPEFP